MCNFNYLRWDMRSSDSNSVMTFKRFEEFVSSFCKVIKSFSGLKARLYGIFCRWMIRLCLHQVERGLCKALISDIENLTFSPR